MSSPAQSSTLSRYTLSHRSADAGVARGFSLRGAAERRKRLYKVLVLILSLHFVTHLADMHWYLVLLLERG